MRQRLIEEERPRMTPLEVRHDLAIEFDRFNIAEHFEQRIVVADGADVLLIQLVVAGRPTH